MQQQQLQQNAAAAAAASHHTQGYMPQGHPSGHSGHTGSHNTGLADGMAGHNTITSHSYQASHALKREGSTHMQAQSGHGQHFANSSLFAPPSLQSHLQRMLSAQHAHADLVGAGGSGAAFTNAQHAQLAARHSLFAPAASAQHAQHALTQHQAQLQHQQHLHAQQQLQQNAQNQQQRGSHGQLGSNTLGSMFAAAAARQDPFTHESLASAPMRQSSTNTLAKASTARGAMPVGESRDPAQDSGLLVRSAPLLPPCCPCLFAFLFRLHGELLCAGRCILRGWG